MHMKHKHVLAPLAHALGVVGYIGLLVLVINKGSVLFEHQEVETLWTPIIMLTLFVISAAITGGLVVGKPILLYISNQKKEAVRFFTYTLAWLVAILLLIILIFQPWQ